MKIKPTISIAATIGSAMLSVILLGANVGIFQRNSTGFKRKFLARTLPIIQQLPIPEEVNEIVAATNGTVYFETDTPGRLYKIDLRNYDTDFVQFAFPPLAAKKGNFKYSIDKKNKIVFANSSKTIYRAGDNNTLLSVSHLPSIFTRSVAISPSSYVLRMFNPSLKDKDQIFVKVTANDPLSYHQLTPVFKDGGFKTDGLIKYDEATHILTYTYFYSNKVLFIDTNLVLQFTLNTIDTFSDFYNSSGALKKENNTSKLTNLRPAKIINIAQSLHKGKLYNISAVKADNEKLRTFKENAVVDIYSIKERNYVGSLYLPNLNHQKAKTLSIFGNVLIAQYKTDIVIFKIPPQLL